MKHLDELRNEGGMVWRYLCTCGYISTPGLKRRCELVQRIHRHRHVVGLAGTYHRPREK
jgi:hypothetical protein